MSDLDDIYEAMARTLDRLPVDRREVFLAKLALLLGHELGDAMRVTTMIDSAARDLDP